MPTLNSVFKLGRKSMSLSFVQSFPSSSSSCSIRSESDFSTVLSIPVGGGGGRKEKVLDFHAVWLRHHCRCEKCFNPKTFQRNVIPSKLGSFRLSEMSTETDKGSVILTWDDGHISEFQTEWLKKMYENIKSLGSGGKSDQDQPYAKINTKKLISKSSENMLEGAVKFEEFMSSSTSLKNLLDEILKKGYGIVADAPPNFEDTKKAVLRISHPQATLFGDFSEWTSDLAHADTAYTSDFVHLHTDTTYFSEPMGLQMFHCLKHEGTGGINAFQDGFQIAQKLQEENEQSFQILSQARVPFHYLEPGKHHFHHVDRILTLDPFGEISSVRYNPHDLAPIDTIPFHLIPRFYTALTSFSEEIEASPNLLKLSPGVIIFLDNWRVLHGRTEFTGFRHLCGAYVGRSDWLSRARVLGLL